MIHTLRMTGALLARYWRVPGGGVVLAFWRYIRKGSASSFLLLCTLFAPIIHPPLRITGALLARYWRVPRARIAPATTTRWYHKLLLHASTTRYNYTILSHAATRFYYCSILLHGSNTTWYNTTDIYVLFSKWW